MFIRRIAAPLLVTGGLALAACAGGDPGVVGSWLGRSGAPGGP
jgi:hypothetical protein